MHPAKVARLLNTLHQNRIKPNPTIAVMIRYAATILTSVDVARLLSLLTAEAVILLAPRRRPQSSTAVRSQAERGLHRGKQRFGGR